MNSRKQWWICLKSIKMKVILGRQMLWWEKLILTFTQKHCLMAKKTAMLCRFQNAWMLNKKSTKDSKNNCFRNFRSLQRWKSIHFCQKKVTLELIQKQDWEAIHSNQLILLSYMKKVRKNWKNHVFQLCKSLKISVPNKLTNLIQMLKKILMLKLLTRKINHNKKKWSQKRR